MSFSHLMKPIRIGSTSVKNRVVMSPLTTNYAEAHTGLVTDQMIEYYRARAAGGVGLVIVEGAIVREDGRGFHKQLMINRDETIEGLIQVASAIKENGSRAILQIMHHGRQTKSSLIDNKQPVAPSALQCPVYKEIPKELNREDIRNLQDCFVEAAKRAEKAGFDGVEFHAAHGYLISGFLSPWSNVREDEYGGDLENRLRFLTEILSKTKEIVNEKFSILCRLSANEYVDGGLEVEEVTKIAKILEKHHVDCLDISAGVALSFIKMSPPAGTEEAPYADIAALVKKEVEIPVISVARILTPSKANQLIKEEKTDLVALGRALVADPNWVKKAEENNAEEIIPCIGCNVCNGRTSNPEVVCLLNPLTGREYKWKVEKSCDLKKIAVVGNGLQGYHLSVLLSKLGHKVTIFQDPNLPFAGLTAIRANVPLQSKDLDAAIKYFKTMLEQSQIEQSTIDQLMDNDFDCLINTTAEQDITEEIVAPWEKELKEKLFRNMELMNPIQILMGNLPKSQQVLIVGGSLIGCETANYLADKNYEVTIIEEKKRVPYDVGNTILQIIRGAFQQQGVQIIHPNSFTSINPNTTVVWATNYPNTKKISHLLNNSNIPIFELGDSYRPDKMAELMEKSTELVFTL